MSKAVVLIDFENLFYNKGLNGNLLKETFSEMVRTIAVRYEEIDEVTIRLYDGWRNNASPTRKADDIALLLSEIEPEIFPYLYDNRKIRGTVEQAVSQYKIDYEWENTLTEKNGVHRLFLKDTSETSRCNSSAQCPLKMIEKASKKQVVACPVEGCGNISFDKLFRREQKMVDAMLGTDTFEYLVSSEYKVVVAISGDMDIFPMLITSAYHKPDGCDLLYYTTNEYHLRDYNDLFKSYGIISDIWQ